jgi:transcriptional regulator with XRE-family HTH domain
MEMPYSKIIAKKIREIREAKGIEQLELADKIGISKQRLNNYENGRSNVPTDLVPVFADALGVSIDTLYGRE